MPGSIVELRHKVVEFVATSGGMTLLELEALEFVDLVQQPPGRGVEAVVGGSHAVSIRGGE
jgi:hypothetical protein